MVHMRLFLMSLEDSLWNSTHLIADTFQIEMVFCHVQMKHSLKSAEPLKFLVATHSSSSKANGFQSQRQA